MLNIGKLAPGGETYYLGTVASGVEDYYTGAGEASGYWTGAAAGSLQLSGRVQPETLRAVLGGVDPATGEPLTGRTSRRSVPGFDLTFRAPKSVSLLYGLGDMSTSTAVRDAHDAAVTAGLSYLEQHAGYSRRGHAGSEQVPIEGFVAAAFRHRTSRAGDPLLHTHVLVSNLGRTADDGQWRTLFGRCLYLHAKTAGYLYQVHLRYELTRRLGVEWGPVHNGCADLAGVPDEVIVAFSQRRQQILEHMAARGETSAKAAQIATLSTRKAKQRHVEPSALGAEWLTRASALGFGPEQVAALTSRHLAEQVDVAQLVRIADKLTGPEGLTAHTSTFARHDVIRAWCDALPAGADSAQVQALADALLASDAVARLDGANQQGTALSSDQVLRRKHGSVVAADRDEPRYSTPQMLALEQRTLAIAVARQDAGTGVAIPEAVEAALLKRPTIAGEQADMVRRLTTSGAGVEVVVGKAGAGKTFALEAAREAWQASGLQVLGCALAARAAAELQGGAGIASCTLDGLLDDLDHPRGGQLGAQSVVVLDEAGMVGTRKLAQLLDHVNAADAKLVLVGDHHQLPEIEAGGAFRALVDRLPAIQLYDNRRQVAAWEREALDELRDGDPSAALDAYKRADRIVVGHTAEAVREQLVSDWWAANRGSNHPDTVGVMIALRVSDVDDLNQRARERLAAAGDLTGPALQTPHGRDFRVGDRVLCLRNDRRLGVINGTSGTVATVELDTGTLRIRLSDRKCTILLPPAYLNAGHLTHGYAITGHKAQGITASRTWILGSDDAYREWCYTALSRGRHGNWIYVVAHADNRLDGSLHVTSPTAHADYGNVMNREFSRTNRKPLALDYQR